MQQHLVLGVVGVLAVGPMVAPAQVASPASSGAGARAARETVTDGRMLSYKSDRLRVAVGKRRLDFVTTKATMCGYSRGNRGTGVRCRQLGQKKYRNKAVRLAWYADAKKRRVATVAYVILSK